MFIRYLLLIKIKISGTTNSFLSKVEWPEIQLVAAGTFVCLRHEHAEACTETVILASFCHLAEFIGVLALGKLYNRLDDGLQETQPALEEF